MSDEAVIVFTFKSVEKIVSDGGSAAWRLDPSRARKCRYLVCTRNAHDDRGIGPQEPHHSAFLVGRVRDVVDAEERNGRYVILIDEYARVEIPDVWKSGDRNPVRYGSLAELGVDPESLTWTRMDELPWHAAERRPAVTPHPASDDEGAPRPLTMREAKEGLALTFGVAPEAIEITVRG